MVAVSVTGVIGKTIGIRVRDRLEHLKGPIFYLDERIEAVRTT